MELFDEKTRDRKSRDTVPSIKFYIKLVGILYV